MMRLAMSPAAAALLRALIERAGVPRDRVLLSEITSVDWQSLTFTGERHEIHLRVAGPDASEVLHRMCAGLEDAEFDIGGHIVVDIGIMQAGQAGDPARVTIEALTIAAD